MAKNDTPGLLSFFVETAANRASYWLRRYWFRIFIGALGLYVLLTKDITIQVTMGTPEHRREQPIRPVVQRPEDGAGTGHWQSGAADRRNEPERRAEEEGEEEGEPAPAEAPVSNLKFVLQPGYAWWHGVSEEMVRDKWLKCAGYIDQYALVAVTERRRSGIPASIILAQGLLESDAGASPVAFRQNNHFPLRCRGPFASPSKSYRRHSEMLAGPRFGHLLRHGDSNYKKWAYGLQRAGYSGERGYAKKLIRIIDEFELEKLDRL